MFETEATLNQFLLQGFQRIVADIPADRINERPVGNGHPPLWVLGHLAICVEMGETLLGGTMTHPEWASAFGPGSSDQVVNPGQYSMEQFIDAIVEGYPKLCAAAQKASAESLNQPHSVELLFGTAIKTRGHLMAHLLTTHLSFHIAQLSGWRRAAGHGPLF